MNNKLYGKLIFELSHTGREAYSLPGMNLGDYCAPQLPENLRRKEPAELPECDEMTVIRHYTNHSGNNFGVNNGFYPLGSCTMKYNPVINEEIAAMKEFAGLHPLQPADTCQGALEVYFCLQQMLSELTGMAEFTLNPCAGAHGELTGLMLIRAYHEQRGDNRRTKVIIPDSAHGTNPASAAVCGLDVVEVKSTAEGLVDLEHLKTVVEENKGEIAAMMMTNPNTLGLFEKDIPAIAEMLHQEGALLYYDGANLNPMLGMARPGDMGFDVMHINLHKTFSTPHGGGGPGSGPVGVREGLQHLLPVPRVVIHEEDGILSIDTQGNQSLGSVGAFFGNFAVILRAYTYLLTLGAENVKWVGPLATLNANYIKERLKDLYLLPIDKVCKHEFVFDGLRDKSTGITTMDVAKRLLDYGFHAPTIYFPLLFHESLMIEPTENESKQTIDEFIEVMRTIAQEAIDTPEMLKTAPHNTPIGRADDVLAAKHPVTTYRQIAKS